VKNEVSKSTSTKATKKFHRYAHESLFLLQFASKDGWTFIYWQFENQKKIT